MTNRQLFEALGLETEPEKARLRRRIDTLVRRKELIRISPGVYRYNADAAPKRNGEGYKRVWRAIRSSKPGWGYVDLARITRMSYTMVRRYCNWLDDEGYIAAVGRNGNTRLYRATQKAKSTQRTPYPPITKDPFEAERGAACRIVRLMMESNPSQKGCAKKIVNDCQLLLRRFGGEKEGGSNDQHKD
ncbi:hypothetical protein [Dethiosulfatarculus sandiegensis]|uniref:hypothetical protein n=1 Tax=Dethiosulfatarculus sandiegensis TaxID=1429043 RepID=UPI0012E0CFEA|nr:hypothetical protein [Dethiosulfatarculus sandiegensis]